MIKDLQSNVRRDRIQDDQRDTTRQYDVVDAKVLGRLCVRLESLPVTSWIM
jgi:hypothetical protein